MTGQIEEIRLVFIHSLLRHANAQESIFLGVNSLSVDADLKARVYSIAISLKPAKQTMCS